MKSADDYRQMLLALLPRGILWGRAGQGMIGAIFAGMAEELARLEAGASRALTELVPQTSIEGLEDWEEELGLPDPCAPIAQTLDERRAAVVRKLQRGTTQSKGFYLRLLKEFGFETDISIAEWRPLVADRMRADDLCFSDKAAHTFIISIPSSVALRRFRTGASRTSERLLDWEETGVECVIAREKPAHTRAVFNLTNIEE